MSNRTRSHIPPRTVAPPPIREHRIPTAGSKPYIAVEGRDRCLWFCESGASKIGRLDPSTYTLQRVRPADRERHADRHRRRPRRRPLVRGKEPPARSAASRRRVEVTEFPLPTPNAGPDAMQLGPDGNIWFSETEVSQIGRITPDGKVTEFKDGITPGSKPLSIVVRDGALWFSEAAGSRIGRITRGRQGHRVSDPEPRQPAARDGDASRRLDLVRRDLDQCARPRRPRRPHHRAQGADAERLAARRHGRRRRRPLVHRELRQQDRPHGAGRHRARRVRHPDAERAARAASRRCRTAGCSSRNGTPA